MRKVILTLILALGFAGTASNAHAAPVRDCGNVTARYSGQTVTIMRNVTVRGESSVTARSATRHMPFGGFGTFTRPIAAIRCRIRPVDPRDSWWVDVRCTQPASGWVMRWQVESGE
jgi:hypothetical protein